MRKIFILYFIFPIILLSFFTFTGIWRYPHILPETFSFRAISFLSNNYRSILISLGSSLFYSLSSVILSFLMSILPASLLSRWDFRGKMIIETILFTPVLIPAITFSMGVHWIFIKFGLSDNVLGVILILTMFSYPYMLRSLISGFKVYTPLFDICAKNLGANRFTRVIKIHLPLLLPSVISGGSVVFLSSFSSYFLVFLIGGGKVESFTGFLIPYLKSGDWNISSLLSLIFLIIPIVLFYIVERVLVRKVSWNDITHRVK